MPVLDVVVDSSGAIKGFSAAEKASADYSKSVKKHLGDADSFVKKSTGAFDNLKKSIFSLKGMIASVGLGVGISQLLQQFETFEVKLQDMGKVTSRSLQDIRKEVMALPAELGSASQLMSGYYQVISAGVEGAANQLDTLVVSSKAAKAAHVDQAAVIAGLTGAVDAYEGELKNVSEAADLFFTIEKEGKTTVSELIPYIGQLSTMSKELGVSSNEMGAAFAQVTKFAGGTSIAATQYRALLISLIKPTKELTELFKDQGGAMESIKKVGFVETLQRIKDAAGGSAEKLGEFLSSQESILGFLSLAKGDFEGFEKKIVSFTNKTGAMNDAWERYEKTWQSVKDTFYNTIGKFAIEFVEQMAPDMKKGLEGISDWLNENKDKFMSGFKSMGESVSTLKDRIESLINLYESLPDGVVGAAAYGLVGRMIGGGKFGTLVAMLYLLNEQIDRLGGGSLQKLAKDYQDLGKHVQNIVDVITGKRDWDTGIPTAMANFVDPDMMDGVERVNVLFIDGAHALEEFATISKSIKLPPFAEYSEELKKLLETIRNETKKTKAEIEDLGLSEYDAAINQINRLYEERKKAGIREIDLAEWKNAQIELINKEHYLNELEELEKTLEEESKYIEEGLQDQFDAQEKIAEEIRESKENIWKKISEDYQKALIGDNEFARQKYLEDVNTYLQAEQAKTGITDEELLKRKNLLIEHYDEINKETDALAYMWENTLNDMRSEFSDFLGAWFKGELEEGKDLWESFCDSLLDMFADLVAQLIAYDLFGTLLGSTSSSGIGLISGGSSGSGLIGSLISALSGTTTSTTSANSSTGLLSNLVSIGKGIYSYFTTGMAAAATGAAVASSVSGISAGTLGAVGGGVLGTTAVSTGVTSVAGALSAIAAAAPYAAAAVAAIGILMTIAGNQNKPDARGYMGLTAGLSDTSDSLFSVLSATYSAEGFDSEDAQKEIERITTEVGNTFSMYEEIWSYLSEESQKALKASLEEIDWENLKLHFFTVAEEGAPMYSWIEGLFDLDEVWSEANQAKLKSAISGFYGDEEGYFADFYKILEESKQSGSWSAATTAFDDLMKALDIPDELTELLTGTLRNYSGVDLEDLYQSFQNAIGSGTISGLSNDEIAEVFWDYIDQMMTSIAGAGTTLMSGGTYSGTGAVHALLRDYFTDYVEESLTNMQASDIYQYMSSDVKDKFSQLTAELFAEDIEKFYELYGESAAKIAKAQRIWDTLENLGEGYEYTQADKLSAMASAWGEAYAAIMEASGEEISDEDLADLVKEYYKALAGGTEDLDRAIMGISDFSIAVAALEGTFDAYIEQLEELGVAVDEITELEEMRTAAMEKLLDEYKHSLGLISDEDYYTEIVEKIMGTYTSYFTDAEEMISWFTSASLDDLKALADALGLDWTDIADDVGWLVEALEALGYTVSSTTSSISSSLAKWQAEILGLADEYEIEQIAEKYGLQASWITEEWLQSLVNAVGTMSEDEFKALADSLGVTTSALMSDISALISALGGLSNSVSATASSIRDIIDDLRSEIGSLTGSGSGGATASSIAGEIEAVLGKDLADLTMTDLLETAQLMQDWYDAAVQEAKDAVDAQKEVIQGQIDALEEQKETIQLEIRLQEQVESLINSIESTMRNIQYSSLNVSLPTQKAASAKVDLEALYQAALTGGVSEVQEFLSFASTGLQQYQNAFKSSGEYTDFYDLVMGEGGWMETIKAKAESGGYDAMILAELQQTNADLEYIESQIEALRESMDALEPDFSGIEAQFETWAATIENLIEQIERLEYILTINWDGYSGDIYDVMDMLTTLADVYGWTNTITLKWISEIPVNRSDIFPDLNSLAVMAGWIADQSGGWNSTATIAFLKNVAANWEFENIEEILLALGYVKGMADGLWTADATVSFFAGLYDRYGGTISNLEWWLDYVGVTSTEIPEMMAKVILQLYGDEIGEITDISQIADWLEAMGITDEDLRMKVTAYMTFELVMSGAISMADVMSAGYNFILASLASPAGSSAAMTPLLQLQALASVWGIDSVAELLPKFQEVGYFQGVDLANAVYPWTRNSMATSWAEGGIASQPTWGVFGEAGPEAFLRLADNRYIPMQWSNGGGSTQEGASEEELTLLREINHNLAQLVTQGKGPNEMVIKGLGKYAKARADDVIIARNQRGKITDKGRYFRDD